MTEETKEPLQRMQSDYQDYIATFVEGFTSKLYSHGIVDEVDAKELKKYFSSPDHYQGQLEKLAEYYYISNGEVFQLFDMAKVLPTLNYKIQAFEKNKLFDKHMSQINKTLYKIKHKNLTRDIVSQTITAGTICGIWLGDVKSPYFYVFDNLKYIFPSYRMNGHWVVTLDMEWIDLMNDHIREIQFKNLSPFVTKDMYERYKKNPEVGSYRYIDLPQNRTVVITTHTLKRNQNRGVGWATQGLYDILHKKKLKDLEKAVANKIINAIAVLTIGDEKDPEYKNLKLPRGVKQKVHGGVKTALERNQIDGITVVSIPEFAKLVFPDVKFGDSLDPKKFESVSNDLMASFGISTAMTNGNGGSFANSKLNMEIFYKRLAVLLEDIETEVYGKLLNLILPKNQEDNYILLYDKEPPLSNKEKIDILMKLHTQEGFSLKAVIDLLNDVDWNSYIDQSIHEQEEMKLPDKILPYASAYTSNGIEEVGRPSDNTPTNENTENSQNNGGNSLPE